jgi:O-antigen ligase
MLNESNEKTLVNYLYLGAAAVTVFVMTGVVTDPVNATKHFLLGGVAFAAIATSIWFSSRSLWKDSKPFIFAGLIFFVLTIISVITSAAPISQNLYGAYGRNTGAVAYISLLFIAFATLSLRQRSSFQKIIYGLFIAGFCNVAYCLWAWQIGDFVGWNNPYNTILGTFGNPNFIGAFLGIFLSVLIAYALQSGRSWKFRGIAAGTFLVGALEIKQSNAIQGIVVTAAGLSLVGFYLVRAKFESKVISMLYVSATFAVGVIALLGALQIGPLTQYIYKTSVSLRGEYWQAGINMAKESPLTGIGMDTYGDWYRRLRDASALIMPGPTTVTNAAHNVNIDILSYGGFPLLFAYLAMLILSSIAIIKVTLRNKKYDGVFVSLTVGWVCYQVQAAISINQIGLAIWGWLLTGALVAYEVSTRNISETQQPDSSKKSKSRKSTQIISPQLVGGIGLVVGLLIAVPPLSADMKWRSAVQAQNLAQVESSLTPTYLTPSSSSRLANAVQLFEQSNLPDIAYKYAKQGVEFNPDYFDAWKVLYYISKSTSADKDEALKNMQRLDPKNKNILDAPKA